MQRYERSCIRFQIAEDLEPCETLFAGSVHLEGDSALCDGYLHCDHFDLVNAGV